MLTGQDDYSKNTPDPKRLTAEAGVDHPTSSQHMKRTNCNLDASLKSEKTAFYPFSGSELAIAPAPMSRIPKIVCLALEVLLLALALLLGGINTAKAASGTWTLDGSSTWSTSANWSGGIIATGVDFTADFSTL